MLRYFLPLVLMGSNVLANPRLEELSNEKIYLIGDSREMSVIARKNIQNHFSFEVQLRNESGKIGPFHWILTNADLSQSLGIVQGVEIARSKREILFKTPNGFVVFSSFEGQSVALFFNGVPSESIKDWIYARKITQRNPASLSEIGRNMKADRSSSIDTSPTLADQVLFFAKASSDCYSRMGKEAVESIYETSDALVQPWIRTARSLRGLVTDTKAWVKATEEEWEQLVQISRIYPKLLIEKGIESGSGFWKLSWKEKIGLFKCEHVPRLLAMTGGGLPLKSARIIQNETQFLEELLKLETRIEKLSQSTNVSALRGRFDKLMDLPENQRVQALDEFEMDLNKSEFKMKEKTPSKPISIAGRPESISVENLLNNLHSNNLNGKIFLIPQPQGQNIALKFDTGFKIPKNPDNRRKLKAVVQHTWENVESGNAATAIRFLKQFPGPTRVFELRGPRINGHVRALGCFNGTEYIIKLFDAQVPPDGSSYLKKYERLCN